MVDQGIDIVEMQFCRWNARNAQKGCKISRHVSYKTMFLQGFILRSKEEERK